MMHRRAWQIRALLLIAFAWTAACGDAPPEGGEGGAARIDSFSASPARLSEAGRVTLSWATRHAVSVELMRGGAAVDDGSGIPASGSLELVVDETTTFSLIARSAGGEAIETATTRVVDLPAIEDFAASRRWVGLGEEVELSWITSGAEAVELWIDEVRLESFDADRTTGSHRWEAWLDSTVELRAYNEVGASVASSLDIRVGPPGAGASPPRSASRSSSSTPSGTSASRRTAARWRQDSPSSSPG